MGIVVRTGQCDADEAGDKCRREFGVDCCARVLVMPLCWGFTHLEATGLLVRVVVFRRGNVEASGKNGTFRRLSQKGGIPLVSLRDGFLCGRTRVVLHPA